MSLSPVLAMPPQSFGTYVVVALRKLSLVTSLILTLFSASSRPRRRLVLILVY
jgi:hypothetical protein